uniref:Uncharacterized protein n=1 Tax=Rhizophora mucronata TaxID=61149 RepID=A0A2P2IL55_RHIMU
MLTKSREIRDSNRVTTIDMCIYYFKKAYSSCLDF